MTGLAMGPPQGPWFGGTKVEQYTVILPGITVPRVTTARGTLYQARLRWTSPPPCPSHGSLERMHFPVASVSAHTRGDQRWLTVPQRNDQLVVSCGVILSTGSVLKSGPGPRAA